MVDTFFILCEECPGKGVNGIDFAVGPCPMAKVDAFNQTRRYRIESPDDHASNEEVAFYSAAVLRYYDPEEDEYYEREGDYGSAKLGINVLKDS